MDTGFSYCASDWAYMSSDEPRWKNHMRRLAEEHPDEVIIIAEPETNNGYLCAKFPPKWLRIAPPRQITMTDEQRANLSARARRNFGLGDIVEARE